MIEGLHFYEAVLLLCGLVLFVALLVVMFVYLARKKSLTPVFGSFLVPVAMIGFPGIQKIEYDNGKVTLEKYAQAPPQNPAETKALDAALARVEARTPATPRNHELLARGFAAASQPQRAFAQASQAADLGADPQKIAPLLELTGQQVIARNLPAETVTISDPAQKAELERVIVRLQAQPNLSADALVNVSRALVAVGRGREATATLDAAVVKAPHLRATPAFQRVIRSVTPP